MWSILTMPAILRNSLPNLLPSIRDIGSYAVVGAIAGGLGVGGSGSATVPTVLTTRPCQSVLCVLARP